MSTDGHRIKWHRNIAENFNPLSRAHERYRQQTDLRTTTYSERVSSRSLKMRLALSPVCDLKVAKTRLEQCTSALVGINHTIWVRCFQHLCTDVLLTRGMLSDSSGVWVLAQSRSLLLRARLQLQADSTRVLLDCTLSPVPVLHDFGQWITWKKWIKFDVNFGVNPGVKT